MREYYLLQCCDYYRYDPRLLGPFASEEGRDEEAEGCFARSDVVLDLFVQGGIPHLVGYYFFNGSAYGMWLERPIRDLDEIADAGPAPRREEGDSSARPGPASRRIRTREHYLLLCCNDQDPQLLGPFASEEERDEGAEGCFAHSDVVLDLFVEGGVPHLVGYYLFADSAYGASLERPGRDMDGSAPRPVGSTTTGGSRAGEPSIRRRVRVRDTRVRPRKVDDGGFETCEGARAAAVEDPEEVSSSCREAPGSIEKAVSFDESYGSVMTFALPRKVTHRGRGSGAPDRERRFQVRSV